MLSLTYALLAIVSGAAQVAAGGPAAEPRPESAVAAPETATFSAEAKAVSNWRGEAVQDLAPTPLAVLAVALSAERPVVTRCVKLNNYWCIKSARWNGEIGTDDEGHVGFASAERGADAAVRLLRRYYLDFDRKSALDIVRRWAPAECRIASGSSGPPALLAVRGIGNTLRARWLAARKTKPVRTKVAAASNAVPIQQRPAPARVSAVPLPRLPAFNMPSIMAGVSAPKPVAAALLPARVPPRRQPTPASVAAAKAALTQKSAPAPKPPVRAAAKAPARATVPVPPSRPQTTAALSPAPRPAPATAACAPDEQRIQNYAARIVRGLELGPADDLKLFEEDGRPLPNLVRVLLAMSSFELGYLGASAALVEAAVERAAPRPERAADPERAL